LIIRWQMARIIKNHGGHIRVKSIPGQGSIFYIRLQRAVLS